LWDYINRAMPWNQPKSLSVDEVYAATAYLLHLGSVIPADFTLSDRSIAQVQQRLPNRNGMTTDHGLWPGREFGGAKPDVAASACMNNCATDVKVTSRLPAHAANSHGNLALQNRDVGAQRGIATAPAQAVAAVAGAQDAQNVQALLQKNNCTACHAADRRVVGPSWPEIAQKHAGNVGYLATKIRSGGSGVWGTAAMPPQSLDEADAGRLAAWLASGAQQ
jgi:cytochrome c551/c552